MSINTQIHIGGIIAIKDRISLINDEWEAGLNHPIRQVLKANAHKAYAINEIDYPLHLVLEGPPNRVLSELIEEILSRSLNSIERLNILNGKLNWQERLAAFNYSTSDVPELIQYVKNHKIYLF